MVRLSRMKIFDDSVLISANYKKEVNILLFVLLGKKIPVDWFAVVSLDSLRNLAKRNKCLDILSRNSDFISFFEKKIGIKSDRVRIELLTYSIESEKKSIRLNFENSKVDYIFLSLTPYLLQKYSASLLSSGSDIDLLVKIDDIRKAATILFLLGYRIKEFPTQEITFYSDKKLFQVDLHHLASVYFDSIESSLITDKRLVLAFTNEFLVASKSKTSLEHLLLANIFNFWNNEYLRGLRSLRDIAFFISIDINLSWEKYCEVAQRYDFLEKSYLIFLLCEKVFNITLPIKIKKDISKNWRLLFVASYFSEYKVAHFPTTDKIKSNDFRRKKKLLFKYMELENYFVLLLINPKVPTVRLLRPKILMFMLKMLFITIYFKLEKQYLYFFK